MTTRQLVAAHSQMLRTVRLYGELGARFGRVHRLAVESTAEAVRALCVLYHGFEAHLMNAKDRGVGYAVFIGKENIGEDRLHFRANADIRIAPVIMGSKNGGIFSIILGVALIAVSFLLPGGGLFAAALFNAGIAMALGGVVQLLSPQPKDPKSKDAVENEPNYAFNGPVNTQAQGNCVPVAYGRPWTGSAVVSAGISTDIMFGGPNSVAAAILAKTVEAWPFDNSLNGAIGGAGTAFIPDGGTGPNYAPGTHNEQVYMQVPAATAILPDATQPHAFAFIMKINGGLTGVNTGYNTFVGLKPTGSGYANLRFFVGSYLDGYEVSAVAHTGGLDTFVTGHPGPGYVSVLMNITPRTILGAACANIELYLDGVQVDEVFASSAFHDGVELTICNSGPYANVIDGIDELFLFSDVLTPEEASYMVMRSYASLVADAASAGASGQGTSGGDVWDIAWEAFSDD